MAQNKHINNEIMVVSTLESLVPKEHLVRKLDKYIDWVFIYDLTFFIFR